MTESDRPPVAVRLVQGIDRIAAADWDACAGADQPFLSHAFLSALETSGSASADTGWLPLHLVAEQQGRVIACAPMYLKSHSYGEYVFDWGWADAYERAGGRYYPKLQVAVPFTPVPGPRLLARPDVDIAKTALIQGLLGAASQIDCSSLHITFCQDREWRELGEAGMMQRTGVQYHWKNRGYRDFDDFLSALKSSKRKMIKKERARVRAQGLELETLTGEALTPDIWDHFYPFYRSTVDKRWGGAYLTKRFFREIGQLMPERIVLVMARHDGRYVAGALNLLGSDTLFGRNWGSIESFDFLHFEACYYAAIEFAIERGLARVEAGAQGQHKLQRGYEPVPTYSAHWIRDPNFRRAVERFLDEERRDMAIEREQLKDLLPYRVVV
ncbi:MAG: GNAT family N-acetyltransferase [Alphaproteobacteria bacterium]|nr:GNAT family N-acetyltransferase [Alphaproteobacteria bacterium]